MSSLMTVRMTRPNSGVVWGFRLYGGAEYGIPIVIPKIMTNSVAERSGLRVNDRLVAINQCNAETMTHEQAKMEIIRTGNELTFVIMRPEGDQPFEPLPPREIPNYPCNYVNPNPPAPVIPPNIVNQKVQMVPAPQAPERVPPPQAPVQDTSPPPPVQQASQQWLQTRKPQLNPPQVRIPEKSLPPFAPRYRRYQEVVQPMFVMPERISWSSLSPDAMPPLEHKLIQMGKKSRPKSMTDLQIEQISYQQSYSQNYNPYPNIQAIPQPTKRIPEFQPADAIRHVEAPKASTSIIYNSQPVEIKAPQTKPKPRIKEVDLNTFQQSQNENKSEEKHLTMKLTESKEIKRVEEKITEVSKDLLKENEVVSNTGKEASPQEEKIAEVSKDLSKENETVSNASDEIPSAEEKVAEVSKDLPKENETVSNASDEIPPAEEKVAEVSKDLPKENETALNTTKEIPQKETTDSKQPDVPTEPDTTESQTTKAETQVEATETINQSETDVDKKETKVETVVKEDAKESETIEDKLKVTSTEITDESVSVEENLVIDVAVDVAESNKEETSEEQQEFSIDAAHGDESVEGEEAVFILQENTEEEASFVFSLPADDTEENGDITEEVKSEDNASGVVEAANENDSKGGDQSKAKGDEKNNSNKETEEDEQPPPANQPLKVDIDKAQEASVEDLPEVLSPRDILASPAFRELPQREAKKFSPQGSGKKAAVPNVVHAQYNSPMGLYSAENIASQYAAQTAGIQKEMENVDIDRKPVGTTMSGTYQVLDSK